MKKCDPIEYQSRKVGDRLWKRFLASEGVVDLRAPMSYGASSVTVVISGGFRVGKHRIRRKCQRTFYTARPTTVPAILKKQFMKAVGLIEEESNAEKM